MMLKVTKGVQFIQTVLLHFFVIR